MSTSDSDIKQFPAFQKLAELGQCMEALHAFYNSNNKENDYVQHPAFIRTLLGPPISKLAEFKPAPIAADAKARNEHTLQIAADSEEPTGVAIPFTWAHGKIRQQAGMIAAALMPHFGTYTLGAGYSSDKSKRLREALGDGPITVTAMGQPFQFNNGGALVAQAYDFAGMAENYVERSPTDKRSMRDRMGIREEIFSRLCRFVDKLKANLVPGGLPFERTGWELNLQHMSKAFAAQQAAFHDARLLFYVMDQDDNMPESLSRKLFWKEPKPNSGQPIAMHSPTDAACGWYGMTSIIDRGIVDETRREGSLKLKQELKATISRQSQAISEQPDMEAVRKLLSSNEYLETYATMETYLQQVSRSTFRRDRWEDLLAGINELQKEVGTQSVPPADEPPVRPFTSRTENPTLFHR